MASIGNQDFTNFRSIRVRGNVGDDQGTGGVIRFVASSSFEGTMSIPSTNAEGNYAWTLPAKNGGIGVTGTFSVDIPAISGFTETAVTVAGIRREDALLVQFRDMVSTVTTGRGFPIIVGARPENGYVFLTLATTGTASIWGSAVCSYTTFR